jgi:hypothetical protein
MAFPRLECGSMLLVLGIILVLMPGRAAAFGAGNIPSIAQVEGHNWRHGDIEDMLATIAFLHGKKWSTLLIRRTYFGNWLRDYSQAVDVASLKGVNSETIRVLVWVLSFLSNGYATAEFEVTADRLGVYRPEEHIDNPLGYAEGVDARKFDKRLRGPVRPIETEIDIHTGMKNYISNERGDWATSAGYLRYSIKRSVHYGRLYTHGSSGKGKEEDLCEALRCLGQALHCLEDFSAHSNYCELALRELGYHGVFPHCGTSSEINLRGKRVFPIVTGTFGGVDFLHSVLGEANDTFTQSEVDQLDVALLSCEKSNEQSTSNQKSDGSRGLFEKIEKLAGGGSGGTDFISLLGQLPGTGNGLASEANRLKRMSENQQEQNDSHAYSSSRGETSRANPNQVPGMSESFDPVKTSKQIYPILEFRDKIVKSINNTISKIPGLEKLLDRIGETLTAFIMGLLAPFIRPIIKQVTKVLKDGSSGVISASAHSQLEPWKNPYCTDPTHSMLSKDHFTNVLNSCAGRVAATILKYVVPRILYAWDHTQVPVDEVVDDILRAFHHPAIRDERVEIQKDMFNTVRKWVDEYPRRHDLNNILGSDSVRTGKNHILSGHKSEGHGHSHGSGLFDQLGHGQPSGSLWSQVKARDLDSMGVGDGSGGLRPDYASSRPQSSGSTGRPVPSPKFGYAQAHPPRGGEAEGYYNDAPYPDYQPHSQGPYSHGGYQGHHDPYQQGPPPAQAGYYGTPQPGPYPGSEYGGPPPPNPQGGFPPYGQQYGGGYGNPPYPR